MSIPLIPTQGLHPGQPGFQQLLQFQQFAQQIPQFDFAALNQQLLNEMQQQQQPPDQTQASQAHAAVAASAMQNIQNLQFQFPEFTQGDPQMQLQLLQQQQQLNNILLRIAYAASLQDGTQGLPPNMAQVTSVQTEAPVLHVASSGLPIKDEQPVSQQPVETHTSPAAPPIEEANAPSASPSTPNDVKVETSPTTPLEVFLNLPSCSY